jgi:broad specificity phosphatase PhoE
MSEFYLVRHGQASFGAKNYDKLSELGLQQAIWLGEYFAERKLRFSQLYLGDMLRHKETAAGIVSKITTPVSTNECLGFNEFDFQNIGEVYLSVNPEHRLVDNPKPVDFYRLLKLAMLAWSKDLLPRHLLVETWAEFQTRVNDALNTVCNQKTDGPILIVSSGGAISMLLSLVMGLETSQVIELNMQIRNTSISHFYYNKKDIRLASFNNVPHLDRLDRPGAITFS